MTENLTESTLREKLAYDLREGRPLPFPARPFSGAGGVIEALPTDVLVFHNASTFESDIPSHHHRHVLTVCLRGGAGVIVDGRLFPIKPGQGMLVFPHQGHHYARFEDPEDVSWLFVTFDFPQGASLRPLRDTPFALRDDGWRRLESLVEAYRRWRPQMRKRSGETNVLLALLLTELLRLRRHHPAPVEAIGPATDADFVQNICNYVQDNLAGDLQLQAVATHMALSESHLQARFRRAVGVSLGRFIRTERIHKACALLNGTSMNVSEVASACGFDSLFSFSRAFKRGTGQSPTAYRKRAGPW